MRDTSRFLAGVAIAGGLVGGAVLGSPAAAVKPTSVWEVPAPTSTNSYGVGCHYQVIVNVDDASVVRLYEGAPSTGPWTAGLSAMPVDGIAIFDWVPKTEGFRQLFALQGPNFDGATSIIVTVDDRKPCTSNQPQHRNGAGVDR